MSDAYSAYNMYLTCGSMKRCPSWEDTKSCRPWVSRSALRQRSSSNLWNGVSVLPNGPVRGSLTHRQTPSDTPEPERHEREERQTDVRTDSFRQSPEKGCVIVWMNRCESLWTIAFGETW